MNKYKYLSENLAIKKETKFEIYSCSAIDKNPGFVFIEAQTR